MKQPDEREAALKILAKDKTFIAGLVRFLELVDEVNQQAAERKKRPEGAPIETR
jgi:hypothetical protein